MKKIFRSTNFTFLLLICASISFGQSTVEPVTAPNGYFIGEKLTYTVSFENYNNVAYAETYVASAGKLGDQDAIEIRSKFKTLNFYSAAFSMLDETRTTFVSVATGMPLYTVRTQYDGGRGKETTNNFMVSQTSEIDLLTAIYKFRQASDLAGINFTEGGRQFAITASPAQNETVKTNAGQFETISYDLQGDFFNEKGWKKIKLNLSADSRRVPVRLSMVAGKQMITLSLASVADIVPRVDPEPLPTAPPVVTRPTPRPQPTPTPYIENQKLAGDLPFKLGEKLNYKISVRGAPHGEALFSVSERIQVNGKDSVIFNANITTIDQQGQTFDLRDKFTTQVNPETLIPMRSDIRFYNSLKDLNQTAIFDEATNSVTFGQSQKAEAPVGTHNLLSLFYAMRSFNLRPSKNATNPINDTRVAVFWDDKATIFTLRPSPPAFIEQDGKRIDAQLINISTGNATLDRYALKVWLSNDDQRLPLRFTLGEYQADLVQSAVIPPK